ncbi:MAG TPA: hypothetical protein VJ063_01525 [Verrucomicrobiae bacterium]|nr:hypothetical protein [Verrucomicrobiae bacterium]
MLLIAVGAILIGSRTSSAKPGKLPQGTNVPIVAVGAKHGVIIAADGSLWAWGENADGWSPVLGLGSVAVQPSLRQIGSDTNWASIAVGWHHNLAIKSDGTLWAWGQNISGQLSIGNPKRTKEADAPVRVGFGNDWKQAAAGGSHSLGLKQDGTLWAWGNNWAGQLGLGTTNRMVFKPAQVGLETNWVAVWAGLLESVALQSDGTLWYWGDNPDPRIPQTGAMATNIFAPQRVSADTNWIDVGFGPWTVLAIKSDGTLWSWGREAHRFTSALNGGGNATPAQVGTNNDWQAICRVGWMYQLLRKKDGSLWAMHAERSQPAGASPKLTRIALKKDFVAFAGGGTRPFGVVVTSSGEVWTWGRVLGKDIPEQRTFQYIAKLLRSVKINVHWGESRPTIRDRPWQLPVSRSEQQTQ